VPITLDYFEGRPAWKMDLEQPEDFRDVELRFRVRLFRLPTGVMLSTWLRLYDLPDRPYSVHRVLDASDGACRRWLDAAARTQVIELMFTRFRRTLSVEDMAIGELCELGQIHLSGLKAPDSQAALNQFLDVFNASMKERWDVARAWERVAETLCPPLPAESN
jgi:hypothetical protein